MKQNYWILRVDHMCRNCGETWTEYVRQYYAKPSDPSLRRTFIIDQYHCVNI